MQIKDVRPESFTKQIRCDRCGRLAELGEVEFHEIASLDLKAGYGSIFGDGNDVQIDLCQHCLKLTLGRWLRVVEPGRQARALDDLLQRFDPELHGGEFQTAADRSFVKPEDMPAQERQSIDVEPRTPKRQIGLLNGELSVTDDFDAPQPPQVMGAFEQMGADAEAVLAAIEARHDQGIGNIADRAEHSVIKNLRQSIQERLGAAAEFNEVLTRQLILTNERLDASPMTDAVVQLASEVFATEADAWTWLNRPHPKLDEETPLQAAETSNGADRVKEVLLAVKSDRVVE
jgi:hypothetical protein